MDDVSQEMIDQMVEALVREADPELIMLFGSRASGNPGPDSDLDLLVVEQQPFGPQRSRLSELIRLRRALSTFSVPKDILVYSRDEVERWKNSINHILADILRDGKKLYERP